jgi:DNA-binding NarL/FixJ family response regulator
MASEDLRHVTARVVHPEVESAAATPRLANGKILTLLVATSHEIEGAGLAALLQTCGHSVVTRCTREDDLLSCSEACCPNIILLSESVVGQEAAKSISRLRARNGSIAIIFLLKEREAIKVANLLNLEVEGILLSWSRARSVIDCVESVARGRRWIDPDLLRYLVVQERASQAAHGLTSREADIARLISRGLNNKEIARELRVSEGTVKMHLHHIYEKLHVRGRTQLALSMAGACG